jgi:hypothetical protein
MGNTIVLMVLGILTAALFFSLCALLFINLEFKYSKTKISELSIQCFFNKIYKLPQISNYVYDILKNVCEKENVSLFEVKNDILNKDRKEEYYASGMYISLKNYSMQKMKEKTEMLKKLFNEEIRHDNLLEIEYTYPRILISEESKIKYDLVEITLAHELGHHYLNIRGIEQSEESADKFILSIFYENLPECFIAIYSTVLKVFSKLDITSTIDYKLMYKKYLIFREEHPELNLPIYADKF